MELERQSIGAHGAPTQGLAFDELHTLWRRGERDRELALHVLFLAWYLTVEPPYLTGYDERRVSADELCHVLTEAHAYLLPSERASDDAEALYVVGLAACIAPWVFGDISVWAARSEAYRRRYRQLAPDGLSASLFEGRGAYGDYFAGHVALADGY